MDGVTPFTNSNVFSSSQPISLEKQLQNAIITDNQPQLERLLSNSKDLLFKPLPNGELPLVYAVKENKEHVVQAMLTIGANPMQQDDQQLSAINYAALAQNYKMNAMCEFS